MSCRIGQLSLTLAVVMASHAAAVALLSAHQAGCGEDGGCVEVLSSKWATVAGIPVSLPAVILYLATLALSMAGASGRRGPALRCCTSVILMAAAYFMAVQVFWIGSICAQCTSTHVFAVFGVLMISRGMHPTPPAFRLPGLRHAFPLLIAAALVGGLAAVQSLDSGAGRVRLAQVVADDGRAFPQDLLFNPFISESGGVGMALDGGTLPISGAEVPEIFLGTNKTQPLLQVALLNDWTCPHCVELHARLHSIYRSPESGSLPPVSLRLLPVFFDQKAEAAHRAMLNVHFGTGNPAAFPTLAEEIASGKLSPDPAAIRARLAEIDPDTAIRWETLPRILEQSVSQAFSLARSQMRRNSSHLKVSTLPQLTVFDAILTGLPSEDELVEFLHSAASRQQALLNSPQAPDAPVMERTCDCEKPGDLPAYVHSRLCKSMAGIHTETAAAVERPDPSQIHSSPASAQAPVDGPQIKFDMVSLKTRPIAMGESAIATFQFTNTGNQTLLVHAIHTGCGCVVAHEWSRTVPAGERGRITFSYDTKGREADGPGEHIRHVWVASNSTVRTDPSYGDQLEIKVPVTATASLSGVLSMTAAQPFSSSMKP
jgi:uncharacterized membrane protein